MKVRQLEDGGVEVVLEPLLVRYMDAVRGKVSREDWLSGVLLREFDRVLEAERIRINQRRRQAEVLALLSKVEEER